ncbi:hypothetical protein C8F00_2318 [Xanthomonas vasicola]
MAASMPPTVPQAARTPHQVIGRRLKGVARHTRAARLRARALQADRVYSIERTSLVACTGAYKDVLAACPAMVGGQGPCSQASDRPIFDQRVEIICSAMDQCEVVLSGPECAGRTSTETRPAHQANRPANIRQLHCSALLGDTNDTSTCGRCGHRTHLRHQVAPHGSVIAQCARHFGGADRLLRLPLRKQMPDQRGNLRIIGRLHACPG